MLFLRILCLAISTVNIQSGDANFRLTTPLYTIMMYRPSANTMTAINNTDRGQYVTLRWRVISRAFCDYLQFFISDSGLVYCYLVQEERVIEHCDYFLKRHNCTSSAFGLSPYLSLALSLSLSLSLSSASITQAVIPPLTV